MRLRFGESRDEGPGRTRATSNCRQHSGQCPGARHLVHCSSGVQCSRRSGVQGTADMPEFTSNALLMLMRVSVTSAVEHFILLYDYPYS